MSYSKQEIEQLRSKLKDYLSNPDLRSWALNQAAEVVENCSQYPADFVKEILDLMKTEIRSLFLDLEQLNGALCFAERVFKRHSQSVNPKYPTDFEEELVDLVLRMPITSASKESVLQKALYCVPSKRVEVGKWLIQEHCQEYGEPLLTHSVTTIMDAVPELRSSIREWFNIEAEGGWNCGCSTRVLASCHNARLEEWLVFERMAIRGFKDPEFDGDSFLIEYHLKRMMDDEYEYGQEIAMNARMLYQRLTRRLL